MIRSQSPTRICPSLAKPSCWHYPASVMANPVTDLGRSHIKWAHKRPHIVAGAFLCPQLCVMAAVRGTPSGVPGANLPGRPTRVQPSPFLAWPQAVTAPNPKLELYPMKHDPARNPSALRQRATAHRAMALAALRADSSLSVRLARYNAAMAKVRALEDAESAATQSATE